MMKILLWILVLSLAASLFACASHQCVDEYYGYTLEQIEKNHGAADVYGDGYIEYAADYEIIRIYFDSDGIARRTEINPVGDLLLGESDAVTSPPTLPEKRPSDFSIYFSSAIGAKNIYDTYSGMLQKDLVENGTATRDFTPDEATLDEIYAKLRECGIDRIDFAMTNGVLQEQTESETGFCVTPLTCYEIIFVADGETYTVFGDATASAYGDVRPDAEKFIEFCSFMSQLMYDAFEAANMPAAEGGYD